MTERQQDNELLADLLHVHDEASAPVTSQAPVLTWREEQRLLQEANAADPATLAPDDARSAHAITAGSFQSEVAEFVRRHPIPTLLLGMGLGYLLTRRR